MLEAVGYSEKAIACFDRALAIDPNIGETYFRLATSLRTLGRLAEARQALETAVAKVPSKPAYYRALAETAVAAGDPHLAAMEAMTGDLAALSETDRIDLHFAMGKACADLAHTTLVPPPCRRQRAQAQAGQL